MSIKSKDIKEAQKRAKMGLAETTRLYNYQIRVLLHFATIGIHSGNSNQAQREIISTLSEVERKGVFYD